MSPPSSLRIDAGAGVVLSVGVAHGSAESARVEGAIDAFENVIVWDEIAQRRGDEEIFLPPFLSPEDVSLRAVRGGAMVPSSFTGRSFFNSPTVPNYLNRPAVPPFLPIMMRCAISGRPLARRPVS